MRRWTAYILLIALLSNMGYNLMVLGYWITHRAYIAAELCVNRERPELKCDGKCYLKKNIKQEAPSQSQEEKLPQLKLSTELFAFLHQPYQDLFSAILCVASRSCAPNTRQSMYHTDLVESILKPPVRIFQPI